MSENKQHLPSSMASWMGQLSSSTYRTRNLDFDFSRDAQDGRHSVGDTGVSPELFSSLLDLFTEEGLMKPHETYTRPPKNIFPCTRKHSEAETSIVCWKTSLPFDLHRVRGSVGFPAKYFLMGYETGVQVSRSFFYSLLDLLKEHRYV